MNITSWILLVIALILTAVLFYIKTKRKEKESQAKVVEETEPATIEDEKSVSDVSEEDKTEEK